MLDLRDTPAYARPDPSGMGAQSLAQTIGSLVVAAAFWAMVAVFVHRGANWARILGTVFAAIGVVLGPLSMLLLSLLAPPPARYVASTVPGFLALLAGTVLLWTRPARSWFAAVQAHNRAKAVNRWRGTPAGPAA